MPVRALLLVALLTGLSAPASQAQQRIASINLCTDLLLLELVDTERIASLSFWAADPELSYLSDHTGGLHLNKSLAEQIVPRQPDLVLAGQFSDIQLVGLLRQLGYRVEVLDVPLNLSGMREHILAFGKLVGEEKRANALADAIDRRLNQVTIRAQELKAADGSPLAVVYGPQGVSPGEGTLMHDLLVMTGFRNLAAEAGIRSYGTLSLERLAMSQPDLLVIDDLSRNDNSIAHRALQHPVLEELFSFERVLTLPPALTACVGPPAAEVAEVLLSRRLAIARAARP